ncbi:MAG: helix-turn-helix transcriptional regulator [Bacteroides sp.]|nr:helix-turn-helix transcriptional regulator [Bacteroides sp.]
MKELQSNLSAHKSASPSKWKAKALARRENKEWLRYSQYIAMMMLDQMDELGLTQKNVAERMGCSQQYVSRVLKGSENLSIETISKIESALDLHILEPAFAERQ